MTKAVVDIETDSLNATKIHCIVAKHYYSNQERCWIGDECQDFANWSKGISEFVMHNGISFDAPVLNRLTGSNIKLNLKHDPSLIGGLIIKVGSVMIDTSLKSKLQKIEKNMIEA